MNSAPSAVLSAPVSQIPHVDAINVVFFVAMTACYGYQLLYVIEVLLRRRRPARHAATNHRFAVLIAARNESATIANLLHSLAAQSYPRECYDVFVIADNCTDDTACIARSCGATVFERHDTTVIGKGHALNYGYQCIRQAHAHADAYEAYVVFDADNICDPGFLAAMNRTFDSGAEASTSFRNSKNYADNWLSAGYGLWFLRESRFLSQAREDLGLTCTISGTGFFVSARVLDEAGGWKWHLLTEDIEFSIDSALHCRRIAYTPDAIVYDEQPTSFAVAWTQRLRWARGFYQVFCGYGKALLKGQLTGSTHHRFWHFDMFMTIAPGLLLTVVVTTYNTLAVLSLAGGALAVKDCLVLSLGTVLRCFLLYTLVMLSLGVVTTIVEWHSIHTSSAKKVLYVLTFPLYMLTYVPIAIAAVFYKPTWKPIAHSANVTIDDLLAPDSRR